MQSNTSTSAAQKKQKQKSTKPQPKAEGHMDVQDIDDYPLYLVHPQSSMEKSF